MARPTKKRIAEMAGAMARQSEFLGLQAGDASRKNPYPDDVAGVLFNVRNIKDLAKELEGWSEELLELIDDEPVTLGGQ